MQYGATVAQALRGQETFHTQADAQRGGGKQLGGFSEGNGGKLYADFPFLPGFHLPGLVGKRALQDRDARRSVAQGVLFAQCGAQAQCVHPY